MWYIGILRRESSYSNLLKAAVRRQSSAQHRENNPVVAVPVHPHQFGVLWYGSFTQTGKLLYVLIGFYGNSNLRRSRNERITCISVDFSLKIEQNGYNRLDIHAVTHKANSQYYTQALLHYFISVGKDCTETGRFTVITFIKPV